MKFNILRKNQDQEPTPTSNAVGNLVAAEVVETSRQGQLSHPTLTPEALSVLSAGGLEAMQATWEEIDKRWATKNAKGFALPSRLFGGVTSAGTYVELYQGDDGIDQTTALFVVDPQDISSLKEISKSEDVEGVLGFPGHAIPTYKYRIETPEHVASLTLPMGAYDKFAKDDPLHRRSAITDTPYELTIDTQTFVVTPIDAALKQVGLGTQSFRPSHTPFEQPILS